MALMVALVAPALSSCARNVIPESWTICVYLCGSNLESRQSWATKTLEEISKAHIPLNATVVVQAGGAEEWHSDLIKQNGTRLAASTTTGGNFEVVGEAGDVSMGEASTLADFLAFCEREYPSEKTAVVLWDHGGGPLKGVCYDETRDYEALSLKELDEGLEAGVKARGGIPYDIVGFDACLMGSLETAVMLSDDAKWLVASEEIEAGAGWDYSELLHAISRKHDPVKVATAICDGYLKKCAKRRKDAAATLSVIDLSKVGKVSQALAAALDDLKAVTETEVKALRRLVFGTLNAECFGGSSEEEGRSNLVDLKGMAEGNAERAREENREKPWEDLVEAVDEAVAYKIRGTVTSGANGLTLWFPQSFEEDELEEYIEMSPLTSYAATLEQLYGSSMGDVKFADAGSITDEGRLSVTIDPSSSEEFFDLYVVNEAVDGSFRDTNVDIADDWKKLTFSYGPGHAVAITLDGMVLDDTLIEYREGYELFSAPVLVDGEEKYLRIAWIWDESEEEGGHYELLGVWNGVDHLTGIADRSADELEPGSTVGALSLGTGDVREKIVVGDEVTISDTPIAPGEYECHFVALDLRGNEYDSDTCTYEVAADGTITMKSIGNKKIK